MVQRDEDTLDSPNNAATTPTGTPIPRPAVPHEPDGPAAARGPCPCIEHGCFARGLAVTDADAAHPGETAPPRQSTHQSGPLTRSRRAAGGEQVPPTQQSKPPAKRPRWKPR
eukprot:GHVU01086115.1.p2 GENE.GHVU01086115.1~~GHVU01086115.1.p2  ORF type:complete len:112 (-),score=2.63 GHVU01086115.1:339-674(-)